MARNNYIPMYLDRTESKRTRDVVSNTEWNDLWNLSIKQGDHTAKGLFDLQNYLFVDNGGEINNIGSMLSGHSEALSKKMNSSDADAKFETLSDASLHLIDASFNDSTGIFTFTRNNGTTFTLDTALEKIAVNFSYNPVTENLIITLADGTTQEISLSALISQFDFVNSDSIGWSTSGNTISAWIKPDYIAALETLVANARSSANDANTSSAAAKSYRDDALVSYSNFKTDLNTAKGYVDQAGASAASAISASSSASTSAANALSYSDLARTYAESAWQVAPEGYAQLRQDVAANARNISMLQDDRDDINDNIDTNILPRLSTALEYVNWDATTGTLTVRKMG